MIRLEPPLDLEEIPDAPSVFVVHLRGGRPYLGRTAATRRRLSRLLMPGERMSKRLDLSAIWTSVECYPVRGILPSLLLYYRLAKKHFPEGYMGILRLRPATFVKVLLANRFPRTEVTTRLSSGSSLCYGPFRTRASAERFESALLDQFQVRRCSEDLQPEPSHPGCIYGEMNRCLRPCQEVVSPDEYRSESLRLVQFLQTGGASLMDPVRAARERFSEELDFEQARRQHDRLERIEALVRLRDELAAELGSLSGVAVYPSLEPGTVEFHFMIAGVWMDPQAFPVSADSSGEMVSMDRRLRLMFESLPEPPPSTQMRTEHVAILARWFYSSSRDAAWIPIESRQPQYRKMVSAVSKAANSVF